MGWDAVDSLADAEEAAPWAEDDGDEESARNRASCTVTQYILFTHKA
jgi:hypothetical protein